MASPSPIPCSSVDPDVDVESTLSPSPPSTNFSDFLPELLSAGSNSVTLSLFHKLCAHSEFISFVSNSKVFYSMFQHTAKVCSQWRQFNSNLLAKIFSVLPLPSLLACRAISH